MEAVLVAAEGAGTPWEHCQVTLEQSSEPTNAHAGPCHELATHPGVHPGFTDTVRAPCP